MAHPLPSTRQKRIPWGVLAGAAVFGFLLWLMLPWMVVVIDDDFWYLRSIIETYQRSCPWTDEWLTPWSATSSSLGALFYALTGSFTFAVEGTLVLAAAGAFVGVGLYLRNAQFSLGKSNFTACLVLGNPTVLFMLAMFTSVAPYMACLWLCIFTGSIRRWGWFFLFWVLGVASRQSAVVWLALPAWALLGHFWEQRSFIPKRREGWIPLGVLISGVLVIFLLMKGMNKTTGQQMALPALADMLAWERISRPVFFGGMALLAGFGSAGVASLWGQKNAPTIRWAGWHGWARLAAAIILFPAAVIGAKWFHQHIAWSHNAYRDIYAGAFFQVMAVIAVLGLVLRPVRPRWDMLLAGLGSWALVVLYAAAFDYHYNDCFFWGFAAGIVPLTSRQSSLVARETSRAVWPQRLVRVGALLLLLGVGSWNVRCYFKLKQELDRVAGFNLAYEQALRLGHLKPDQVGNAPFGYLGWLFQDYYGQDASITAKSIGGFVTYTDPWQNQQGTNIVTEYDSRLKTYRDWFPPRRNSEIARAGGVLLHEVEAPLLWFYKARYQVLRKEPAPGTPASDAQLRPRVDLSRYTRRPYPLNDAEWRHDIETHQSAR